MQRQIALDTETTGKADDGTPGEHRIIEIGCVEIIDRTITGRQLRHLINPQREVDAEAEAVHGLNYSRLRDCPLFGDIADELIAFIRGAELLIHNARFDTGFLDSEWERLGYRERTRDLCSITDTVALAKQLHPNSLVNLNSLCRMYDIDTSERTLHGALLDAQLLAEVYLAMTGGQDAFSFEASAHAQTQAWRRSGAQSLPRMNVDDVSHALHLATTIDLLAGSLQRMEDGTLSGTSPWSDAICLQVAGGGSREEEREALAGQRAALLEQLLDAGQRRLLQEAVAARSAQLQSWRERLRQGQSAAPQAETAETQAVAAHTQGAEQDAGRSGRQHRS